MVKNQGKRNRQAGHSYEREVAEKYRQAHFNEAKTARYSSREQDNLGKDICGVAPMFPQCKFYTNFPNPYNVFKKMKNLDYEYPVLHVKLKGKGRYVVINEDHYFELMQKMVIKQIFTPN